MTNRRQFLRTALSATAAGATLSFPQVIGRALAISAHQRTRTIEDVEHVVILMQENRSFDHYFGTLNGVRGFGDRFPIPVPDAPGIARKTVWFQSNPGAVAPTVIAPFHLNTQQTFGVMRVTGTPHRWPDAQAAWDDGRLREWPRFKNNHAMGFYNRDDIPFQFAMAEVDVAYQRGDLAITMHNHGVEPAEFALLDNAYHYGDRTITVPAGRDRVRRVELERSARWYDFTVVVRGLPGFRRRFAGRVETGRDALSDPALGGPARGDQT